MKETQALDWLYQQLPVGDDCAITELEGTHLLSTVDMLHKETDFPEGTSHFTVGWRCAAVSLSDIAAMAGQPEGILLAYGAPSFDRGNLESFLKGAQAVTKRHGAEIIGGDLDKHSELTVVSTALGTADNPVFRQGASPGDLVAVTGQLGRTAVALNLFEAGQREQANDLFQFEPRITEGLSLAAQATSMMDISDGLARSLYQLKQANQIGFEVDYERIPLADEMEQLNLSPEQEKEYALYTGEDYELLFTIPPESKFEAAKIGGSIIGEVVEGGVYLNVSGQRTSLEDRGYVH